MHTRRWAPIALLLPLACSEAQPWTRILYTNEENHRVYTIVQADPAANTCTRIELHHRTEASDYFDDRQAGVDVKLRGVEHFEFRSASVQHLYPDQMDWPIARRCSTAPPTTDLGPPPPIVSGKLKFHDFINAEDSSRPCEVSFELTITQQPIYDDLPTESFEIHAKDVAITDVGCPHPDNYEARFTELDAAYGELNGLGTVVFSSWDPTNEVCVWARLMANEALASASEIDVPGAWAYTGLRVASVEREACVATELLDPNLVDADDSISAAPMHSSGSVSFGGTTSVQTTSGAVDAPCSLDVDVALQSFGEFYWVPSVARMKGTGIAVAGACD